MIMHTNMQRVLRIVSLLTLSFSLSGCVYALRVASPPADVKLGLQSPRPEQHFVRVALAHPVDYPVGSNGRVEFTVPSLRSGCDVLLFGIKMRDGSAEKVRVIEVRDQERVVRKFSLADVARLPRDEAGYRIVKVGD
jgi:hypothetical protein